MKNQLALFSTLFIFLISCSKDNHTTSVENINDISYVENKFLTKEQNTDIEGYLPLDGYIPNQETAVKVAFSTLSNIYGEKQIKEQLPFSINLEDDIWIIQGFIDENKDGGSAYIEISKKTGEIFKILHTK